MYENQVLSFIHCLANACRPFSLVLARSHRRQPEIGSLFLADDSCLCQTPNNDVHEKSIAALRFT